MHVATFNDFHHQTQMVTLFHVASIINCKKTEHTVTFKALQQDNRCLLSSMNITPIKDQMKKYILSKYNVELS